MTTQRPKGKTKLKSCPLPDCDGYGDDHRGEWRDVRCSSARCTLHYHRFDKRTWNAFPRLTEDDS